MKFVNVSQVIKKLKQWLKWFGGSSCACCLCVILVVGCANVTPVVDSRKTVSFSGNDQNAGIVAQWGDGSLEITPTKLDQYNSMIDLYGKKTVPVTEKNFGIKPLANGNYNMTAEAAERFYNLFLIRDRERIKDAH